jgi:phage antirepressor YoqD-like protein
MENKIVKMGYGYVSDVEIIEAHKKKKKEYKNDDPPEFYSVRSVSYKTGIGRNKIYSLLREFNYVNENNFPFPKYVEDGYFKSYPYVTKHSSKGVIQISPKGISLIVSLNKLLSKKH